MQRALYVRGSAIVTWVQAEGRECMQNALSGVQHIGLPCCWHVCLQCATAAMRRCCMNVGLLLGLCAEPEHDKDVAWVFVLRVFTHLMFKGALPLEYVTQLSEAL